MSSTRCLRSLAPALFVLGAACNGAIAPDSDAAPPIAEPAPRPAAACAALGDEPTTLLDEAPSSTIASDGAHLYFLRSSRGNGREAAALADLARVAIAPSAARTRTPPRMIETVLAADGATGPAGAIAGAAGRVAFTRGVVVEEPYRDRVEAREVVVLESGAREAVVVHTAAPEARIEQLAVSPSGDVVFVESGPSQSTLLRWRAGRLETVSALPSQAAMLPDALNSVFLSLAGPPLGAGADSVVKQPSIAVITGAGAAPETVLAFPRERNINGLVLVGTDASSVYFTTYPGEGVELHRVAKTGGEDEVVIPSAWSLTSVLVDEQPSVIAVTNQTTIVRQPKDGSQRTVLATAREGRGGLSNVTADACNVYWTTADPPALMGRRR